VKDSVSVDAVLFDDVNVIAQQKEFSPMFMPMKFSTIMKIISLCAGV
jgi:hypothetical protein